MCELEYVEAHTSKHHNGSAVICRVYTLPGAKQKGQFAVDFCAKCLDFYAEKFAIDYPLPKLDMVSIPDFAFGAMENWGLTTYRELYLLADKSTTLLMKVEIAYTLAHELAHQWFGNLVTMEWWTDLW